MTNLGPLSHFLGISVTRSSSGLHLSQKQYALDLVQRAGMTDCNPVSTPIDTSSKLSINDGDLLDNPTSYRSLTGALQYLTLTRPEIAYAVHQACLFMHAPRTTHLNLVKRIIRYIKGTLDLGTHIVPSPPSSLIAYSDADWAGCPDTRRSTTGFCVYLGDNLISWSAKRQLTVLGLAPKYNIMWLLMLSPKAAGSASFFRSCIGRLTDPPWFIVMMSLTFNCLLI
jgi:hypothetical protein